MECWPVGGATGRPAEKAKREVAVKKSSISPTTNADAATDATAATTTASSEGNEGDQAMMEDGGDIASAEAGVKAETMTEEGVEIVTEAAAEAGTEIDAAARAGAVAESKHDEGQDHDEVPGEASKKAEGESVVVKDIDGGSSIVVSVMITGKM